MKRNDNHPKADSFGRTLAPMVPNFRPLYESVRDYVREHQGEKGYIDTQDDDHDTIYGLKYDFSINESVEVRVHAVRVNPNTGALEVIVERDVNGYHNTIEYSDEDFKSKESSWLDVWEDEELYLLPLLVNLAENLEGYVNDGYRLQKRKFRVAIHWEVAYVDTVEAYNEEQAYEIVKQKAQDAPSDDYQWLEEMDWEATEEK